MIKDKKSSDDEMVLTFLKSELKTEKPVYRNFLKNALKARGLDEEIIINGNLSECNENLIRTDILREYRGYKKNELLFEGFPDNVTWYWGFMEREDLVKLRYLNSAYWVNLSGYTRSPSETAKRIIAGKISNEDFLGITEYLKGGGLLPPIILITDFNEERYIILDGIHRATAYALEPDYLQNARTLIGYTERELLVKWRWARGCL